MPPRSLTLAVAVALSGLVAATSAFATEGPPAGGQPLPNPLQPVLIPPAGQSPARPARPRVLAVRITPRRVVQGRVSRLRIALAAPGRVRIVIDRRVRRHRHRVSRRTVAAPLAARVLRLRTHVRPGRYRVTVIALDDQGHASRPVRRMLTVVAR
jgi:hypothetical protein